MREIWLRMGLLLGLAQAIGIGAFAAKTVPLRAGNFDDAVADSVADFSGTQGAQGWSYGSWSEATGYAPGLFFPLEEFGGGVWRDKGATAPRITRNGLAATRTSTLAAVRRWRPSRTGSLRLVGTLQKIGTSVAACRVLVNGREAWKRNLALDDTIPHSFDILLTDLPKGAAVDMAVSSGSVVWKAQVLSEPCTAWRPDLPIGPQFTDAQKAAQRKAGKAVLDKINALASGQQLTLPAGNYRFSGDVSLYPHIKDLHDVTLNAPGVTFWFEPPLVHGLEFDDCRNVIVKGLTIDCDPLPFFQGRITALDAGAGTVSAELMPGYAPGENSGNRTISYYRPDGSYIRNGILGCSWSRRAGTGLLDIKAPAPGVSVGDYLACVIRTGQQLRSINCGGMCFEDVNVYAGGGMAVLEAGGPGGSVYRRVRCTRRPGTNRLHAFGADGFHFSGIGRGPMLDRCEGAYFADDEVNLHGQFGAISKTLAPDHYLLTGAYYPGQRLDFWSFTELEFLGTAMVASAAGRKAI